MSRPAWPLLSAAVLLPTVATAQVVCGDVVAKGATVTLAADLGPCRGGATDAALAIAGGTLDLAGRTVSCAPSGEGGDVPQGIVLADRKSRVRNGTVVGCAHGLLLVERGRHVVEDVTVTASREHGVSADDVGGRNKLIRVTANDNGDDGIHVASNRNKIVDVVTTGNVSDGVDIAGDAGKNKLTNARAENNGDNGIEVGGEKNKLKNCTASGNAGIGIDFNGERNKLKGGAAQANGEVDVNACAGNKVKKLAFGTASSDCQ